MTERQQFVRIQHVNNDFAGALKSVTSGRDESTLTVGIDAAKRDKRRLHDAAPLLERTHLEALVGLSDRQRTYLIVDFAERQKERINNERRNTLLLGRLLKNETIPLAFINADGTFQTDKIKQLEYFKENPHVIKQLALEDRQLSEKSKTRQRAQALAETKNAEESKVIPMTTEPIFLTSVATEEEPKNHKVRKKSRLAAAAAAVLLAVTPAAAFVSEKRTASGDKASSIPAVEPKNPTIPQPGEVHKPKPNIIAVDAMTKPVTVKPGDSEWKIVKRAVTSAGIKPTDATVNVLTDITAWASLKTVPNPDVVRLGQVVKAPNVELITCVDSRVKTKVNETQKRAEKQIVTEIHDLNGLYPQSKRKIATERKQRLKGIVDYCHNVIIFSRN